MRQFLIFAAALAAVPALRADVLLHYENELTMDSTLPAQFRDTVFQAMNASQPRDLVERFSHGKTSYTSGSNTSIFDATTGQMTVINSDTHRYATGSATAFMNETAGATPQMPPQAAAAMAAMKGHSEMSASGKSEIIDGIDAEEHLLKMTIDGPAIPGMPSGPFVRLVMHLWTAKEQESARVPALAEMAQYQAMAVNVFDPMTSLIKSLRQMPGFEEGFSAMMKQREALGAGPVLRTETDVFMPMLATLTKQLLTNGSNPFGAEFDPDSAVLRMKQELKEISTDPIPASVMQPPDGYGQASIAELVKDMLPKQAAH